MIRTKRISDYAIIKFAENNYKLCGITADQALDFGIRLHGSDSQEALSELRRIVEPFILKNYEEIDRIQQREQEEWEAKHGEEFRKLQAQEDKKYERYRRAKLKARETRAYRREIKEQERLIREVAL